MKLGNLSSLVELNLSNNDLSGCYSTNLFNLCDTGGSISNLNNLDAPWEDFCLNAEGACICIDNLIITQDTPFQNLFQSDVTITTYGFIVLNQGQEVEFNSKQVRINGGFSVNAGAEFKVRNIGCN